MQSPVEARGANLYIGNCIIDGGKLADFLIRTFGVGIIIENSWLKDPGGDMVSATEGGLTRLLNNLFENGGWLPGAHGDWLQLGGTNRPADVEVIGNTVYQTNTPASTQGFMIECNSPQTIASGRLANNTIIAVRTLPVPPNNANATNFLTGVTPNLVTGTVTIEDNYMDKSGSAGGFGRGLVSPKVIVQRNRDLITGRIVNANNSLS